jgi:hypothetical protein
MSRAHRAYFISNPANDSSELLCLRKRIFGKERLVNPGKRVAGDVLAHINRQF